MFGHFPAAGADVGAARARERLQAQNCALMVIDIQEKLLPPIHGREQLLRNAQLLLRLANILQVAVLVTTQYARGLGGVVPELAALLPPGTTVQDKLEFGCFSNAQFCANLKSVSDRRTLLLCGMEAHICVMQTALGALDQGYSVHIASDAIGSRTEWNWKIGLERMREAGAVISSTEMIIYELLGGSGSDAFKQMLPYLKGPAADSRR